MTSPTTGIILIHGAGLGSFVWEELSPLLDLPSFAVDFPNRGQGNKNRDLTFDDYVNDVLEQCEDCGFNKFYLVAHSIGGLIGLRVAEHFGERVNGFIALGAAIPKDGGSFVSCLPFPQSILMPAVLRLAGTKAPESAIRKALCSDLDDAEAQQIIEQFTEESKALFLKRSKAKIPDTARLYIMLNKDVEFSLPMQCKMAVNLGEHQSKEINCGHLPMLSHPKETADMLNGFCHG